MIPGLGNEPSVRVLLWPLLPADGVVGAPQALAAVTAFSFQRGWGSRCTDRAREQPRG